MSMEEFCRLGESYAEGEVEFKVLRYFQSCPYSRARQVLHWIELRKRRLSAVRQPCFLDLISQLF